MSKIRYCLIICVVVLVTFGVYGQVLQNDFVKYDDYTYIVENPYVRAGLTLKGIVWAFTSACAANWHPLTWLSHMLDVQLFGLNPAGHHLVNLLFHTANTVLLLMLLKKMTGALWQSICVALLFALHPLHVQSVAWAAERKDVLSTFLAFLTIWSYVRYTRKPGIRPYLPVFVLYALGLMAKPMLVTLPFLLLLLDYWPLGRLPRKETGAQVETEGIGCASLRLILWEKTPLLALSAASCFITYSIQQRAGAVLSLPDAGFFFKIATVLVNYWEYVKKMFWPMELAIIYPIKAVTVWQAAGAALFMFVATILAWRTRRSRPYLLVGWLWYVGTLAPVIGLVRIGHQLMADRYTYLPLIGLFIMAAWGVPDLLPSFPAKRDILSICTVIVLCVMTLFTWFQIKHWRNSITLFENAVSVTEDNWLAHLNLGGALVLYGRDEEALYHFYEAMRITPGSELPYNDIANVYAKLGQMERAVRFYKDAIRIKPNYADAHLNLGRTYLNTGDTVLALDEYRILKGIDARRAEELLIYINYKTGRG